MAPIQLSPRLLAVAKLVPKGATFADIGTDHAQLPVWLLQQGIITSAIAADLNQGPLDRARLTAVSHHCMEHISLRLGNGLAPVTAGEADVIAIAGMGGDTIVSILEAAPWTATTPVRLLLQPMTSVEVLRAWLWRNGYQIHSDRLVEDDRGPYVLLEVTAGIMEPLSLAEEWAGRQTASQIDPLRSTYLDKLIRRIKKALVGLEQSSKPQDIGRTAQWRTLLAGLEQLKEEWDAWQQ